MDFLQEAHKQVSENEKTTRLKRYREILAKLDTSLKLTDEAIKMLEDFMLSRGEKPYFEEDNKDFTFYGKLNNQ